MDGRVAVLSGSLDKEEAARDLGAERFINTRDGSTTEALQDWEGGANIVLATAPAVEPINYSLPVFAPGGTLAVLGLAPDAITVDPATIIFGRLSLLGSPSGSRKDIRNALAFAAAHGIRPRITTRPLEEASNVLKKMNEHRLREVLTIS